MQQSLVDMLNEIPEEDEESAGLKHMQQSNRSIAIAFALITSIRFVNQVPHQMQEIDPEVEIEMPLAQGTIKVPLPITSCMHSIALKLNDSCCF